MYIQCSQMARKQFYGVRLEEELLAEMRAVAERYGIPVAEQIRRGIRTYLSNLDVPKKAGRKRTAIRKRP
jgi:antitoxin component of RelBE/YafQ-DinJ toxin-antitoxin module